MTRAVEADAVKVPAEQEKRFRVKTETSGLLPITGGVVKAAEIAEFAAEAVKAGADTLVFNHDKDDKLVGISFTVEVG